MGQGLYLGEDEGVQFTDVPVVILAVGVHNEFPAALGPGIALIIPMVCGIPGSASAAVDQTREKKACTERCPLGGGFGVLPGKGVQDTVCGLKHRLIHNRRMRTLVLLAEVFDFSDMYAVFQDVPDLYGGPLCGVLLPQDAGDGMDAFPGQEEGEHLTDLHGLIFIDLELPIHIIVPGGGISSAVEVSRLSPGDAAHGEPLCNLVLLQLSEHRQDSDHGPPKGGGGIEVLVNADKVRPVGEKVVLDQRQGVFLAPAQPVQLVDHNGVDFAFLDSSEKLLEGWAVGVPAGISAVHVGFQQCPPLCGAVRFQTGGLLVDGVVFELMVRGYTGVTAYQQVAL